MPNSSFTCPICNEPIEGSHTSSPRCGFKFVGATQTFNPVVTEVDGQVCEAGARHQLEVLSGPYAGESFTLGNGTFTVGRDPKCDIFLSNMTVSRHNSTIVIDGANAKIIDAGSTNGTWVDGQIVDRSRAQAWHACPDRHLRHGLQAHPSKSASERE